MPTKNVSDLTYEEAIIMRAQAKLALHRKFADIPGTNPPESLRVPSEEDLEFIRGVLGDKVDVPTI